MGIIVLDNVQSAKRVRLECLTLSLAGGLVEDLGPIVAFWALGLY